MNIRYFFMLIAIALTACQSDTRPAAPLDDRAALEQLANAYDSLRDQLPVSPAGLTPEGKLKFVEQVFQQAGYDYGKTLQEAAQVAPQNLTDYHRDMMQLLLLPNQGLSEADGKTLYNESQYANIEKVNRLHTQ